MFKTKEEITALINQYVTKEILISKAESVRYEVVHIGHHKKINNYITS